MTPREHANRESATSDAEVGDAAMLGTGTGDPVRHDDYPQHRGFARLLELSGSLVTASALFLAAELGVADELTGGSRTVAELAAATRTDPASLHRMLRLLASVGVFTEEAPGRFALTAVGAHLSDGHPQSARAVLRNQAIHARAFLDAEHSLRTGKATFPITFGAPMFEHLRENPAQHALFTSAMAQASRLECATLLDTYDFTAARHIVDVGGGNGMLLAEILRAQPTATGEVLDQPHLAAAAGHLIRANDLTDRLTFTPGDFFSEVPVGGDIYLLKWIIHDWSDAEAVRILRTCREAMSPGSRLLLVERVIPPGNEPHPSKISDFAMLVLLGGQERTGEQYLALLDEAGLHHVRVIPSVSTFSVIEAS